MVTDVYRNFSQQRKPDNIFSSGSGGGVSGRATAFCLSGLGLNPVSLFLLGVWHFVEYEMQLAKLIAADLILPY